MRPRRRRPQSLAPISRSRDLEIRYGPVPAVKGISFRVRAGEQLTLLGPSGCGKTTTLRAIAGLERPSAGAIRIGGETMYASAEGINIPAEKRGLSMVFQSYAIWPHMTVFENVAYGLRVRRKSRQEILTRVREALALVQMAPYENRPASALSGGQQQRVALARACVFQPSVLLFDEPLSNLDAKLRADMRIELRELQHRLGITSVYVTHDLEEALAMSDRIVVMRDGNIEQIGSPTEIYNLPRNAFVADFIGSSNLIAGRLRPDLASDGLIALETSAGQIVHGVAHGRAVPPEPRLLGPHGLPSAELRAAVRLEERLAGAGSPLRLPGRFLAGERDLGRPRPRRPLGGARSPFRRDGTPSCRWSPGTAS